MVETTHLFACYHCGLPVIDPQRWTVLIQGKAEPMCCPGCQTVAGVIVAGGLENYYKFRSDVAVKADETKTKNENYFLAFDDPILQKSFVTPVANGGLKTSLVEAQLFIEDIHCAACCWLIEHSLKKIPDVTISVNLGSHKALLRWDTEQHKLSDLLQRIESVGYHVLPYQKNSAQQQLDKEHRSQLLRLGISGIVMMQAMMFALALYSGDFSGIDAEHKQFMRWFSMVVTLPVMFYAALPFYKGAWRGIKSASMGMDVSISLALVIAFIASAYAVFFQRGEVYFDSISMFVFLLLLARFAENNARRHLSDLQTTLIIPMTCLCLPDPKQPSRFETIAINKVVTGDVILVRAGENIPLDGVIIDGASTVNEAAFSGEQGSLLKKIGDIIYAGTINGDGILIIRVSAPAGKTRFDMITRLSEWSQTRKPRVSVIADRLASGFTFFVLSLAAIAGIYWYLHGSELVLTIVLSILVVSCPCALSLATPSALAFCYQALRARGILITSANMIEQIRGIDRVVFDKTGTLTCGNFSITQTHLLSSLNEQTVQEISSALEKYSEHPIAAAFKRIATDIEPTKISVASGRGVEGYLNGECYRIGSREFCMELTDAPVFPFTNENTSQTVYLAKQKQWLACFYLQDTLRPEAGKVINDLKKSGKQVEILSGDSSGAAEQLAKQLGIDYCRSNASPEQKLEYVNQLQAQGHRVLMIGDGINDIPVLAKANVSIAMNSASDLAKIKADAILLGNSLQPITDIFNHCEKGRRIIMQNIAWALLYNGIALPLAAMGLVAPWIAAVGMSFSSLWVTFNSLRLRKLTDT